jgi:hypothetical protein
MIIVFTQIFAADQNVLKQPSSKLAVITQWAKAKTANARRLFFCLGNPSQCDPKEVKTARAWLIGVPVTIIITVEAAIGIPLTVQKIEKMREAGEEQDDLSKKKDPYRIIEEAYNRLEAIAAKLDVDPRRAPAIVGDYPQFVDKISQQEYEKFKGFLDDALANINTLSEREGIAPIATYLEEECSSSNEDQKYRQFMCDIKSKFAVLSRMNTELNAVASILDQIYKTKK